MIGTANLVLFLMLRITGSHHLTHSVGFLRPPPSAVLKLSRNAIPALFGKAERNNVTSGDARGGTLLLLLLRLRLFRTKCRYNTSIKEK